MSIGLSWRFTRNFCSVKRRAERRLKEKPKEKIQIQKMKNRDTSLEGSVSVCSEEL